MSTGPSGGVDISISDGGFDVTGTSKAETTTIRTIDTSHNKDFMTENGYNNNHGHGGHSSSPGFGLDKNDLNNPFATDYNYINDNNLNDNETATSTSFSNHGGSQNNVDSLNWSNSNMKQMTSSGGGGLVLDGSASTTTSSNIFGFADFQDSNTLRQHLSSSSSHNQQQTASSNMSSNQLRFETQGGYLQEESTGATYQNHHPHHQEQQQHHHLHSTTPQDDQYHFILDPQQQQQQQQQQQEQQQYHFQQQKHQQHQIYPTANGGPNHVVVLHQQQHLDSSNGRNNGQHHHSQPSQSFQPQSSSSSSIHSYIPGGSSMMDGSNHSGSTPGHFKSGNINSNTSTSGTTFYVPFQPQQQQQQPQSMVVPSPHMNTNNNTTILTSYNPKIFVGGLSWSSNETSLQHYFSKFGNVDSVEIMRDRLTGNPRGFAFVIFSHDQSVDRVLANPKHIIDCKLVDVKRAHARSTIIGGNGGSSTSFQGQSMGEHFLTSGTTMVQQQSVSLPASKSSSPVPHTFSSPPKMNSSGSPPDGFAVVRSSASSPVNSVATSDSFSAAANNNQYHLVTVAPMGSSTSGGSVMNNNNSTSNNSIQHTATAPGSSTKPPLPDVQLNKIFVGGLHHAVDREELKHYFSKYGKVCDACVMFDPVTRRSRGFGFITYDTNDAAQRAMADQVHSFRDKAVELKLAQPKAGTTGLFGGLGGPPATMFATSSNGIPGGTAMMITPTKGGGPGQQHIRAMSTIDFRPSGVTTPNHRTSSASRDNGASLHVRSSSAGADLFMLNHTNQNLHHGHGNNNSTRSSTSNHPHQQHHHHHHQILHVSETGEHLSLEPLQISNHTTDQFLSNNSRPLARRATSVGLEFSSTSSSNHLQQQHQQRHPNRGGSFVLKLQGADEGTLFVERPSMTMSDNTSTRRSAINSNMTNHVNRNGDSLLDDGEPQQHPGVGGVSGVSGGAMSELETALYRRVSQLEGQLANAQSDIYEGQQQNVKLQEHVTNLEHQVNETRRCERALISMLKDRTKQLQRLVIEKQEEGTTDSSADHPSSTEKTTSRSSVIVGDNPWDPASSSNNNNDFSSKGGTLTTSGDEQTASNEIDLDQLKSIVTGLNGRLGSHDADVSERLLVSALFADGQTDQALMDVIVELDERLATIEHEKKKQLSLDPRN